MPFKFYNREREQAFIKQQIENNSDQFIFLSGRRRIGKTSTLIKTLDDMGQKYLYFYNPWNTEETNLLNAFVKELNEKLDLPMPLSPSQFDWLWEFVKYIITLSWNSKEKIVYIFDEFSNYYINCPTIYGDFQQHIDLRSKSWSTKMFFLWSHYSLMRKIFCENTQPLFERHSGSLHLKNFRIETQAEILQDYHVLSPKNLFFSYLLMDWVPKHLEYIFNNFQFDKENFRDKLLELFLEQDSFFIKEWKVLLANEFWWKGYNRYFSILEAIASWKTKRAEIANVTGIDYFQIGSYLDKLETYYNIVSKENSIVNKRRTSYRIKDKYLSFFFRFINKHSNLIELGKFEALKEEVNKSINTYQGFVFEDFMKELLKEVNSDIWNNRDKKDLLPIDFHQIGSYSDKNWENEIDIIMANPSTKQVLFLEAKYNKNRISETTINGLKRKVAQANLYNWWNKMYWVASLETIEVNGADVCISVEKYLNKLNDLWIVKQ